MPHKACPKCGGADRFYLIARPRNGGSPFWLCNQCRHVEHANPDAVSTAQPLRQLTPEQRDMVYYGYRAVAEWCATALWTPVGCEAIAYLRARGLSDETIHQARLGYHPADPRGGVGPVLWARDKGAYEGARLGGLLGPQGRPKSLLRDTITIPYIAGGHTVLLRARAMATDAKAKYLSPSGVPLYAGGPPSLYMVDTLVGLDDGAPVVLTEGEFKALLPHQHGIASVAQPGVGYFPEAFARQLARRTVVIAYDVEQRSDPFRLSPGEQWTLRIVERLTGIDTRRQIAASVKALDEIKSRSRSASPDEETLLISQLEALHAHILAQRARLDEVHALQIKVKVLRLPRASNERKVDLDMFVRNHGPDALRDLMHQAQDGHLWHALHYGGGFEFKDGGISNGTFVANYQARIVETVFQCDGQETTAIQRLTLRTPAGRQLAVDIASDDWADDRQARLALRAGLREGTFDDDPREVLRAIRLLSNQGDQPLERTVYTCTGWEQINNHWHFLASDGAITASGTTPAVRAEIDSSAVGNHYALCGDGDPQAGAQAWLRFLRGEVCPQPLALILAGQAALPLLHAFSGNTARSLIWLFHQSGALKTALLRAGVMALYGPAFTAERADGASVPKWDATSVGLGMLVFYYRDMPLLIDDYKQGVIHPDQFKRFLHNYSESTGRTRGTKTQQIDRIRPARCIVFSTAEDLPSIGDYGIEARLMAMQLHPDATNPGALAELQRAGAAGHLAAFWRGFVQALASELDTLGAAGMRERLQSLIHADDSALPGHKRAAGSLRQNRVAWLTLSAWLCKADYLSEAEAAHLNAAHLNARQVLADVLVARQEDTRPASIFRTVLGELIDSGDLVIERPGMRCPRCDAALRPSSDGWYCTGEIGETRVPCSYHLPTNRIVGFVCDDGSYGIYAEKAFREVSRVRNDQRQPFAFSSTAIWQQLDADGLLVRTSKEGKGRYSVNRRNPARHDDNGYGKPQRVLVLKAAALECKTNDDPDNPYTSPRCAENVEGSAIMGSVGSVGSQADPGHTDAIHKNGAHGITWDHMGSQHQNLIVHDSSCDPTDPTVIPCMGSEMDVTATAQNGAKNGCDPTDPMIFTYTPCTDAKKNESYTDLAQMSDLQPDKDLQTIPPRINVNDRLRRRRERIEYARALLRAHGTPAALATDIAGMDDRQLEHFIQEYEQNEHADVRSIPSREAASR